MWKGVGIGLGREREMVVIGEMVMMRWIQGVGVYNQNGLLLRLCFEVACFGFE